MIDTKFTPVDWCHNTNIYEVNLRQYTREGTFNAFSKELFRLKDMGVETLWFMPITPIAIKRRLGTLGSYYACSDYTNTNPEFGTIEDFKNLVKTAHQMGFKVLIDWVANHTGYDHIWTKKNPDFYKKNDTGNFYDAHGWEDVIDLNYDNYQMRSAMIDAMHFWVTECNIDGFRCDMANLVPLDFWKEARMHLDAQKKLFWLAECEEPAYHSVFDTTYAWKLLHTMEAYWRKEISIRQIENILGFYNINFPAYVFHLFFTSNHDENSHSGSEYERIGDAVKVFAILICTWHSSIPLIYSGQEAANKKRLSFFDKDVIDWNNHYPLHDFYKTLFQLRKTNPALGTTDEKSATIRIITDTDDKLFGFLRKNKDNEVLIFLNLSQDYYWMHLTDEKVKGIFKNVFTNELNDITKNRYFEMRPWDFYIYEK